MTEDHAPVERLSIDQVVLVRVELQGWCPRNRTAAGLRTGWQN